MAEQLQKEEALKIFSEHKTHARHLESYLLSFTQVFLLLTGGLWGYALSRHGNNNTKSLELVSLIFGFHLFYSMLGELFTVRLTANFRAHYERADTALKKAGLDDYVVLTPPENKEGKIRPDKWRKWIAILLTVKAYFVFLYAGAAGIDAYYLTRSLLESNSRTVIHRLLPSPLYSLIIVFAFFLLLAGIAYLVCTKEVRLTGSEPTKELPKTGPATTGKTYIDSALANTVLPDFAQGRPPEILTERELAVLRQLALGRTDREIADALCISEETVKTHVGNILDKLQLTHRTQALIYALKHKIVSLEDL